MTGKPRCYLPITKYELAELFSVSYKTVEYWIAKEKLNPRDLEDIIDKYNNRWKLDKRRKVKDNKEM